MPVAQHVEATELLCLFFNLCFMKFASAPSSVSGRLVFLQPSAFFGRFVVFLVHLNRKPPVCLLLTWEGLIKNLRYFISTVHDVTGLY
jgi:hypothetical protein